MLDKDEIVSIAKKNLAEGENWHKKVNVREIVFGLNDGSISTLALLAGVTGGALAMVKYWSQVFPALLLEQFPWLLEPTSPLNLK